MFWNQYNQNCACGTFWLLSTSETNGIFHLAIPPSDLGSLVNQFAMIIRTGKGEKISTNYQGFEISIPSVVLSPLPQNKTTTYIIVTGLYNNCQPQLT